VQAGQRLGKFKSAGSATLPLTTSNGKRMRMNKAFMEKGASKKLFYFCFPQCDRVLTNDDVVMGAPLTFELNNGAQLREQG
jgi:hypothetical protein